MLHPPGFGELLPEQAPLIALGLLALLGARRRKLALLLLGWIMLAARPRRRWCPLLIRCMISWRSRPGFCYPRWDSCVLLEFDFRYPFFKLAAAAVIVIATIVSGAQFVRFYFRDYPVLVRLEFRYGLDQVVREIEKYGDDRQRVFLTELNQGYIYVLFFRPYPPALFQQTPVTREDGLFGKVLGFDRYLFPVVFPESVYGSLEHRDLRVWRRRHISGAAGGDDSLSRRHAAYYIVVK